MEKCADGLRKFKFDGWGLGGWLFDAASRLDLDMCQFYYDCMERGKQTYALGIGNPQAVADFKAGKETALKFLLGQLMKVTRGRANPQMASQLLKKKLGEK